MRHLKHTLCIFNIAVVLSLVFQLISPAVAFGIPVYAAARSAHAGAVAPHSVSVAPTAPAAAPDPRQLLDSLVRQALAANGWDVVSLSSQLTPVAAMSSTEISGTGQWNIGLLDENQQSLTLAGTLNYRLSGQARGSLITGAQLKLNGTLQSTNVSLALDVRGNVQSDGSASKSDTSASLGVTRNGQTSTASLHNSTTTQAPAYGLVQAVTQSTLDRGGKTSQSTQTLTARNLGHAESEVWLHAEGQAASTGTSLDEHLFQRVSGTQVAQYLDRFELKTSDNRYSLQDPASISGTLDGDVKYSITLVDQNGKTTVISHGTSPQGLSIPMRRVPGLAIRQ